MKRRRYTGHIACEFCGHLVGGSSKSGLFSNYNSHCLAKHSVYEPSNKGVLCQCRACKAA